MDNLIGFDMLGNADQTNVETTETDIDKDKAFITAYQNFDFDIIRTIVGCKFNIDK